MTVPCDEHQSAFASICAELPDNLRVSATTQPAPEEETAETRLAKLKPVFCLCEMPEGDYPRVRIFRGLEGLLRHMGGLEGQEIAVWAFHGHPLRFTTPDKDGRRYLLLANKAGAQEEIAVPILRTAFEKLEEIPVDLLADTTEFQADGWLGDPTLTESSTADYYQDEGKKPPKPKKKKKKSKADDDDEFDAEEA